jgi:serine protease Do
MNRFAAQLALILAFVISSSAASPAGAEELSKVIERLKPSVVAIATYSKTRAPAISFIGTGFAVSDGRTVITNAHVVKQIGTRDQAEVLGILIGTTDKPEFRLAKIVSTDAERDIAELSFDGPPLPALKIGNSDLVKEGDSLLFTGFPLGVVLGYHHVTHRGMVSAITPTSLPALTSQNLNAKMIMQLRSAPFYVFQLDGTAYPGNSGSPLYNAETGEVVGIINKVFVQGTKEAVITHPSGITYAVPGKFIRELLEHRRP